MLYIVLYWTTANHEWLIFSVELLNEWFAVVLYYLFSVSCSPCFSHTNSLRILSFLVIPLTLSRCHFNYLNFILCCFASNQHSQPYWVKYCVYAISFVPFIISFLLTQGLFNEWYSYVALSVVMFILLCFFLLFVFTPKYLKLSIFL